MLKEQIIYSSYFQPASHSLLLLSKRRRRRRKNRVIQSIKEVEDVIFSLVKKMHVATQLWTF